MRFVRVVGFAAAGAVASWLVLALVLGNAGLQQTLSLGPLVPEGALGAYLAAGVITVVAGYLAGDVRGVVALLVVDVLGAIAATIAVGELEPVNVPAILVVITAVGLQPVGFLVGTMVGKARRQEAA